MGENFFFFFVNLSFVFVHIWWLSCVSSYSMGNYSQRRETALLPQSRYTLEGTYFPFLTSFVLSFFIEEDKLECYCIYSLEGGSSSGIRALLTLLNLILTRTNAVGMIIVIPILQMKESRFKVVKNLLGISSGGRVGFKSTPFWLQILFLAIVHLSHIDMSPNHIALKSIYMINESHIYISNIDLPLSSKLGYPTACRYLRSNLPQSELQTAFSLHRCAHAQSSPLSVSLFPFSYSGQSVVVALDASFSFMAHMQVTGKSNGTNNVRNPNHLFPPPWSLPFYCLFSAQLSGWLSLCHSPVQKFLVLSCPMHGVSIIVIAFQLETHPSILDFILLGPGPFVSWLPFGLGQ